MPAHAGPCKPIFDERNGMTTPLSPLIIVLAYFRREAQTLKKVVTPCVTSNRNNACCTGGRKDFVIAPLMIEILAIKFGTLISGHPVDHPFWSWSLMLKKNKWSFTTLVSFDSSYMYILPCPRHLPLSILPPPPSVPIPLAGKKFFFQ